MANKVHSLSNDSAWVLFVGLLMAVMLASVLGGGAVEAAALARMRQLYGEEQVRARQAMARAERMRAEFEARYPWRPPDANGKSILPNSPSARQDYENAVAAYEEVMTDYLGSETAGRAGLRLSSLHTFRGESTKAIDQAKEVASLYSGTKYETRAHFAVGLLYLQSRDDPREAANWFAKIPKPSDNEAVAPGQYSVAENRYLSAQQNLARCELAMGRHAVARRRYDRLSSRYPQYKDSIEDTRDLRLRDYTLHRVGVDPEEAAKSILDELQAADPLFWGDASNVAVLQPADNDTETLEGSDNGAETLQAQTRSEHAAGKQADVPTSAKLNTGGGG